MAFKERNNQPDLSGLLVTLQQSKLIQSNPALFQTINELIKRVQSIRDDFANLITVLQDDVASLVAALDLTYLTSTDETATLPNSRNLLAGTNVTFDDTTPGERTVNVTISKNEVFLTGANEVATLPNSRQLLAGTNITFDDTVANQRTISASGGSAADHVVMSDGGVPALPVEDGFGNFIYILYTP